MKKEKITKPKKKKVKQFTLKTLPKGLEIRTQITITCDHCNTRQTYFFPDRLEERDDANVLYQLQLALLSAKGKITKGNKIMCHKCVELEKTKKKKENEKENKTT